MCSTRARSLGWRCENLLREVHEDAGPQLGGQSLGGLRLGSVGRRQPALDRLAVFPAAKGQGQWGVSDAGTEGLVSLQCRVCSPLELQAQAVHAADRCGRQSLALSLRLSRVTRRCCVCSLGNGAWGG